MNKNGVIRSGLVTMLPMTNMTMDTMCNMAKITFTNEMYDLVAKTISDGIKGRGFAVIDSYISLETLPVTIEVKGAMEIHRTPIVVDNISGPEGGDIYDIGVLELHVNTIDDITEEELTNDFCFRKLYDKIIEMSK